MLKSLIIKNYALIESLDITFPDGFSVITGETGAGKSIMLGALGLLLGQRADVKSLRTGASKCLVEAVFMVGDYHLQPFFEENELEYDDECIVRREILASGKSRAFVNDSPVPLTVLRQLGEHLIDIHSQHQNLLLNTEDFQLDVLDALAANRQQATAYAEAYAQWQQAGKALRALEEEAARNRADEDFLRFQLEQLDEARLVKGEQAELEQESELLSHAEEIKEGLFKVSQQLDADEGGVLSALADCRQALRNVQRVYAPAQDLEQRVDSVLIELKDILGEVTDQTERIDFNPARLDEVTARLNLIYGLQQKHHVQTEDELLALTEDYRQRLQTIVSSDDEIAVLQQRCDALWKETERLGNELTATREHAARLVEEQMCMQLKPLGMPNVRFKVEMDRRATPSARGLDTVRFLFSANKNGTLNNVAAVASGGEIARVMLSIKALIAGAVKLPTIVFDEIDTGVSGEIAARMAHVMRQMAVGGRQVISITHLPQIAALGGAHYKVYKQDNDLQTTSYIRSLSADERVEEIAHMLSGTALTEAALNNARELLASKNQQQ